MVAESLHVVLGAAAGGTGSAVVRELATRGRNVRAVTRSGAADVPEGVEQMAADVGTIDGARRAARARVSPTTAHSPTTPSGRKLLPPMTNAILDGAAAAGAKPRCSQTTSTRTDLLTDR